MKLADYLSTTRQAISADLNETLSRSERCAARFSGDSTSLFTVMESYAGSGKMLRGILACLGSELFRPEAIEGRAPGKDALALASALELFQAGLLVHDDIMDKDELRRGMPTMHKLFERSEAEKDAGAALAPAKYANVPANAVDYKSLGEGIGICAGDIFYFIAWNNVASLGANLGELFSKELVDVCLAQIKDVRFGTLASFPRLDEVFEVYAYKTARYTITLPLCAGAILAGRMDAVPALEKLGLPLGLLFQLQDDYLGLFGDEKELGKPTGSDIREGKKTPFMILLAESLSGEEERRFQEVFGQPSIDQDGITCIRDLIKKHGVDAKVRALAEQYATKAAESLEDFSANVPGLNKEGLDLLRQFIGYSLSRKF
jgi:geranylgeranyl diphosphate synthase, type I